MMCNGSLQYSLKGGSDGFGINWIGDLGDAQNPWRMLLVNIQCLIVHIMRQLFKCEHFGVISVALELQFTNHNRESCFEFLQRNGAWPFAELFNFPIGTTNFHGVYGCRGHNLQCNIR